MIPQSQQTPQQPQIPLALKQAIDETEFLTCHGCSCTNFQLVYMVKTVSLACVGRIGEYLPIQVPVYRCADCGDILKIDNNGQTT